MRGRKGVIRRASADLRMPTDCSIGRGVPAVQALLFLCGREWGAVKEAVAILAVPIHYGCG